MSVICRLHPWMSSMDGIHRWKSHPWMTSTDDASIHGWHFSIHGWHPQMTFLQPLIHMPCYSPQLAFQNYYINWRGILIWKIWCIQFSPKIIRMKMPSMDGEMSSVDVIHGWRNVIHGWRDAIHGWRNVIRECHLWMERCHPWMEKCHPWMEKCHPWMEKCHSWMSSMDGEMSSMDGSVIYGCYPWMTSMDEDDGWRTWTQPIMMGHFNLLHIVIISNTYSASLPPSIILHSLHFTPLSSLELTTTGWPVQHLIHSATTSFYSN